MNIIILCFAVSMIIGFALILIAGSSDVNINIFQDRIEIRGMYGLPLRFFDIDSISLIDKTMDEIGAGRRTNGIGDIGQSLKGHFKSESNGDMMLFVGQKPHLQFLLSV